MKTILTFFSVLLFTCSAFAIKPAALTTENEQATITIEQFLAMTPATIAAKTGKNLNFIQRTQLKVAQKQVAKYSDATDLDKNVYIILAIVGLGWLAMGLLDDWTGNNWIIALVLSLLFWIPGVIYSLIKMKDYY